MSFKSDLRSLSREIKFFDAAEEFEQQIENSQKIATKLEHSNSSLELALKKRQLVSRLPSFSVEALDVTLDDREEWKALSDLFDAYLALWQLKGDKSSQDEENRLKTLTSGVSQYVKTLETFHAERWDSWVALQKQRFLVQEIILENQKTIFDNQGVYEQYKLLNGQFEHLLSTFDYQEEQLEALAHLADKLHTLRQEMNTDDLPKAVQDFFDAVHSYTKRVTLEFLTEEVFFWLRDNGLLAKFIVKQNV